MYGAMTGRETVVSMLRTTIVLNLNSFYLLYQSLGEFLFACITIGVKSRIPCRVCYVFCITGMCLF